MTGQRPASRDDDGGAAPEAELERRPPGAPPAPERSRQTGPTWRLSKAKPTRPPAMTCPSSWAVSWSRSTRAQAQPSVARRGWVSNTSSSSRPQATSVPATARVSRTLGFTRPPATSVRGPPRQDVRRGRRRVQGVLPPRSMSEGQRPVCSRPSQWRAPTDLHQTHLPGRCDCLQGPIRTSRIRDRPAARDSVPFVHEPARHGALRAVPPRFTPRSGPQARAARPARHREAPRSPRGLAGRGDG